jgi:hypothetical protein
MSCAPGVRGGALWTIALVALASALPAASQAATADGREYELVSPPDKQGASITSRATAQATPSGDRIAFGSTNAFGGSPSSALLTTYVADRSANGWTTTAVDPPALIGSNLYQQGTVAFSPDLGQALQASRLALAPGAVQEHGNVYLRDHATGGRVLMARAPGDRLWGDFTNFGATPFGGASADFSHVVFESRAALVPGAVDGTPNVYEWAAGDLRLVTRLQNDEPSPDGGRVDLDRPDIRRVSEDGRRIFFNTSDFGGPLFMREDGNRTVPLSLTRRSDVDPPELRQGDFGGASRDGSVVYFTASGLMDEWEGTTLYRYETETDELTDLTSAAAAGDEGPGISQVLAVSGDGERVYFSARGVLAPGAEPPELFGVNYYVWDAGGIRFIGHAAEDAVPSAVATSPSGRYFAVSGFSQLTAEDITNPVKCPTDPTAQNPDGVCRAVYLYDAEQDSLACVSCDDDAPPQGFSDIGGTTFGAPSLGDHRARSVHDDGSVFIETPNALDELRDVNGRTDVYRWRAGEATLISSGTSDEPSLFADASAGARDAFFITSERLVPIDFDNSFDLYDARIGGGIAAQHPPTPPAPCADDDCQGPPGAAPAGPLPGTQGVGREPPGPPRVDLLPPRRRAVGRAGRIALRLRSSGAVSVRLRAAASIAGRPRTVAAGRARPRRAGTVSVRLRLSRPARLQLARRGSLRLTVTASLGAEVADRVRFTVRESSSR